MSGIFHNALFCIILFSTFLCQILIVQFGSEAFGVADGGLRISQWIACVCFGLGGLIWQWVINVFIMKTAPSEKVSRESQAEYARKHPEKFKVRRPSKPVVTNMALANERWHTLRHGVRTGNLYANVFHMSLKKGVNLHGAARKKFKAAHRNTRIDPIV